MFLSSLNYTTYTLLKYKYKPALLAFFPFVILKGSWEQANEAKATPLILHQQQ